MVPRLLVALGVLPPCSVAVVDDTLATGLDPPAPRLDADWVARLDDGSILPLEWQGYRDKAFRKRLFDYHLLLALRHYPQPVRTVVIWSRPATKRELAGFAHGQLSLVVDHIVLAEQDPTRLLADPATACFAMACRSDDTAALAVQVVEALVSAPPRAAALAALAAAAAGEYIYAVFRREWEARGMEPIIIDELARMLEDKARKEGKAQGRAQGNAEGRAQGEAHGRAQGEARGRAQGEAHARLASARLLVADLAELLAIVLDEEKRTFVANASPDDLDALRVALKRDRAWPTKDPLRRDAAVRGK